MRVGPSRAPERQAALERSLRSRADIVVERAPDEVEAIQMAGAMNLRKESCVKCYREMRQTVYEYNK